MEKNLFKKYKAAISFPLTTYNLLNCIVFSAELIPHFHMRAKLNRGYLYNFFCSFARDSFVFEVTRYFLLRT